MANKIFRYKKLAGINDKGKRIKSWHKPILLIRKKGKSDCSLCYFHNNDCGYMYRSKQLPECIQGNKIRIWYYWIKIKIKK
jgi:hypothetical protein